jgi:hypothetical protein
MQQDMPIVSNFTVLIPGPHGSARQEPIPGFIIVLSCRSLHVRGTGFLDDFTTTPGATQTVLRSSVDAQC